MNIIGGKKFFTLIIPLLTAVFAVQPALAQAASPFILPPAERWQGRVNYTDGEGARRSDLYEIIFVKGGTCIVSVNTKVNGKDVYFDADGLWSESSDGITGASVLRIECDFPDSPIDYLHSIQWSSLYQFDNGNTRFTLLVRPYPDAPRNVRIQFVRVEE